MRRTPRFPLLLALGTLLVLASNSAWADDNEIYTCRDENGVPSFQNDPCPVPAGTVTTAIESTPVRVSRRQAVQKPPRSKQTSAPAERRPTTTLAVAHRRVGTWMVVARAENMPAIGTRNLGSQSFPTRIGRAPAPSSFASPEQTWLAFLAAVESDDRALATACLIPSARETLGSLDRVRRLLNTFTRIDDVGDVGPYWSIQGVRDKQRPKWILFEETPAGEWKIAGI
jgi:hypothetical protein